MQVKRRVSASQIAELFQKNEIEGAGQEKICATCRILHLQLEPWLELQNGDVDVDQIRRALLPPRHFLTLSTIWLVSLGSASWMQQESSGVLPSCWTGCKKVTQHLEISAMHLSLRTHRCEAI